MGTARGKDEAPALPHRRGRSPPPLLGAPSGGVGAGGSGRCARPKMDAYTPGISPLRSPSQPTHRGNTAGAQPSERVPRLPGAMPSGGCGAVTWHGRAVRRPVVRRALSAHPAVGARGRLPRRRVVPAHHTDSCVAGDCGVVRHVPQGMWQGRGTSCVFCGAGVQFAPGAVRARCGDCQMSALRPVFSPTPSHVVSPLGEGPWDPPPPLGDGVAWYRWGSILRGGPGRLRLCFPGREPWWLRERDVVRLRTAFAARAARCFSFRQPGGGRGAGAARFGHGGGCGRAGGSRTALGGHGPGTPPPRA